jgi:hypothetical protein
MRYVDMAATTVIDRNSVRHIHTLGEIGSYKRHYQMRCSHHKLQFSAKDTRMTCATSSKNCPFVQDRDYFDPKQIYAAEKDT